MIVCPHCHQKLKDGEYFEDTEYHNQIMGNCKKCGYTGHWMEFSKD